MSGINWGRQAESSAVAAACRSNTPSLNPSPQAFYNNMGVVIEIEEPIVIATSNGDEAMLD